MGESFRFEFDLENKILLMRFEDTRLTDESLAEVYAPRVRHRRGRPRWHSRLLAFIHIDVSAAYIRQLAGQEPAMPRATERARIVGCKDEVGFGMARMFQMLGESTRPLLPVVRSLDEALGAEGAYFGPLT